MGRAVRQALAPHVSAAADGHREFLLDPAIDRARRFQARALAAWAMDCLCLRRDGLDLPTVRRGTGELAPRAYRAAIGSTAVGVRSVPKWAPARKRAA